MQMGVACALTAVDHQYFHLPHWQVLDVLFARPRLLHFTLAASPGLDVLGREDARSAHRQISPLCRNLGRRLQKGSKLP